MAAFTEGSKVLIATKAATGNSLSCKAFLEYAKKTVGAEGSVEVRQLETLPQSLLPASSYDAVIIGSNSQEKTVISDDVAEKIATILKPGGSFVIKKSTKDDCTAQNLVSTIKLSGLVSVEETKDEISARKPNYEVGSSMKLKLGGVVEPLKVWQLDDEGDDEMVNEDDLLDENDLKKPDPESLKVCGTTGQRKACNNCSCGLAEELEKAEIDQIKQNTQNAKSSCGSCYLGDAFRCAGCPYLGMPAFKAGEKVTIDMSSDL